VKLPSEQVGIKKTVMVDTFESQSVLRELQDQAARYVDAKREAFEPIIVVTHRDKVLNKIDFLAEICELISLKLTSSL
jgi:hypothetical protein